MFRSFEANSWAIQRKGSGDLAKSSAPAVDPSNLGQAPNGDQLGPVPHTQRQLQAECRIQLNLETAVGRKKAVQDIGVAIVK